LTVSKVFSLVACAALLPLAVPARQVAVEDQVKVSAVRFYRAEASLTQVKAFVQVPLSVLTASSAGNLVYRVAVQLKDSTGLKLAEEAWPLQHASADLQEPGAFTVNSIEFTLRPGKYRLEVLVEDSVSGRQLQTGTELIGYSGRPDASDLVLSPLMRQYVADSQPRATEWKSGQILVTSIAQVQLNPAKRDGSRIFYLMEAYTTTADSGTMQVTIRDSAGKQIVQTPPARVQLAAGGGVLRGQLNLEGLPPGRYGLTVAVNLAGATTERSADFTMSDLQTELNKQALVAQAQRITDQGYFELLGEEELDRAAEPLEYVAESRELRAYRGATVEAKRRFLVEFWQRRDPDPATPRNEAREQFYGKIAYADSTYRERGSASTPGWKTDRGRLYAKYGAPDEVLDRERRGRNLPYLVWRYTRTRDTWYILSDRSGLGSYKLVHSNDRSEAGSADWRDILGPDAVRDAGNFLGVDFFDRN
jgi:GWxTD domain-containing protein